MQKSFGFILILIGAPLAAVASPVPEISPASGVSAIVLLSGAILMIRGRRKH